jgi:hypothetical protein
MSRKNILSVLSVGVFILLAVLFMSRQGVHSGVDPVVSSIATNVSPAVVTSSQVQPVPANNATAVAKTATAGGDNQDSPSLSPGIASEADKTTAAAELEAALSASLLSRTPKGIWANRIPLLEDYMADIPADYVPALANFRKQFPELDPTDIDDFNQAYIHEFHRHGDTLNEETAEIFNAWLEPMDRGQQGKSSSRFGILQTIEDCVHRSPKRLAAIS